MRTRLSGVSWCVLLIIFFFFFFSLQIAYQIAREGFSGKLKEMFLVLSDDEPRPAEAEGGAHGGDPTRPQDRRGQKHRMEVDDDDASVHSVAPKKPDQTRSNEKGGRNKGRNK